MGNAAEETIYIGEADPVGERLKNHASNKEGWAWGVYFVDKNHKIGKTEVQYLEYELIQIAKQTKRAILMNKNNPTSPSMSNVAKASAQAFLADMLLILPMLGITAFSESKTLDTHNQTPSIHENESFDTIVIPAREDGFKEVFLNQNCWYAIRINSKHIPKIKYIAGYQVAPIAAITHIAEVLSIEPYQNSGKFLVRFKSKAKEIGHINRSEQSQVNMQSSRYALMENILRAKNMDDVWPK